MMGANIIIGTPEIENKVVLLLLQNKEYYLFYDVKLDENSTLIEIPSGLNLHPKMLFVLCQNSYVSCYMYFDTKHINR